MVSKRATNEEGVNLLHDGLLLHLEHTFTHTAFTRLYDSK
jgi:hypothetical protein